MGLLKKKTETSQSVPTSALPDIIFILLFFFMVATKVKTEEKNMVDIEYIEATQLKEFSKEVTNFYIYIGPPKDYKTYGTTPRVQMNGAFVTPQDIPRIINQNLAALPSDKRSKTKIKVFMKIDKGASMGLVIDVQEKLKEVNTRNLVYSTNRL